MKAMAGKLREKARDVRKSLFKLFCFCSAATQTADDGEAPDARLRFVMPRDLDVSGQLRAPVLDEPIAVPRQSQVDDGKVPHQQELGLTGDMPRALKGRVPHPKMPRQHVTGQQVPGVGTVLSQSQMNGERKGAMTGGASATIEEVLEGRVPQAVAVPQQTQNGERRGAVTKTEIASMVDQMTGGASGSIEEVLAIYEFIERALTFTRSDLPVFQPSQAAQAPRPVFAPRAAGAVFAPGAVVVPAAIFPIGATSAPGAGFPLARGVV